MATGMMEEPARLQAVEGTVEDLTRKVGQQVRVMRSRRGLTRKNLALHSDVSERYLAQLEQGEANISLALLWRVANALGVSTVSLLPSDQESVIRYEPLGELIGTFSKELQERACHLLRERFGAHHEARKGVALVGLRGAGKSTLGTRLAERFGVPFLRLNTVISELAGMDMNELISLTGQSQYRRLELQALQRTVAEYATVVLETGGSLISETETYRLLRQNFFTLWVRARPEDHMERVTAQGDMRPMAGNRQAMADLKSIIEERKPDYQLADAEVMTSGRTVEQSLDEVVRLCQPYLTSVRESLGVCECEEYSAGE
jgi:XRE family aerobic/anaerobic benzoate catabolism transcriptional regulator